MRTFKTYSLRNFPICSTVLLTVVTMPYIPSLCLPYFITRSLNLLTTVIHSTHPFSPPLATTNLFSVNAQMLSTCYSFTPRFVKYLMSLVNTHFFTIIILVVEKETKERSFRKLLKTTELVSIQKQKLKYKNCFLCPICQLLANCHLTRLERDSSSHPQVLFTEAAYIYFSVWVLWSLHLYWETSRKYVHFNRRSAKPWKNVQSKCLTLPLR